MARAKPWTDRYWLATEYQKRGKTIEVIAAECTAQGFPVTAMTIYNWITKFGLKTNSRRLGSRRVGGNGSGKGYYS